MSKRRGAAAGAFSSTDVVKVFRALEPSAMERSVVTVGTVTGFSTGAVGAGMETLGGGGKAGVGFGVG
jgi:hypothetical protein